MKNIQSRNSKILYRSKPSSCREDNALDMDEFQGFFKKYSPLLISLVGILILVIIGELRRAWLLLAVGLGMQYVWIRIKYPRVEQKVR